MARRLSPTTITPSNGGRLMSDVSKETVGLANYLAKVNLRRVRNNEVLREGDAWFAPNAASSVVGQSTLPANVVGMWELDRPNGERAIVAATRTDLYRFNYTMAAWVAIGTGFSTTAKKWDGESLDGYLILNNGVDLPCTFRVEDSSVTPIYEMREMGIASVGTIAVYNGFLVCADISEIPSSQLAGVMLSSDPYGRLSASLLNRIRYKIVWSDYGNPRNWAVMVAGTITALAKNVVTLDYPVMSLPVGSKLAVINAGPNGGTLGGQVGIDDGVPIVSAAGVALTLSVEADGALTYPVRVFVTRFADTSTFSGSSSIQDDSSAIIRLKVLKNALVVYRETGIFTGRYTAVVETPFVFKPIYHGRNVPYFPDCLEDIGGDVHVYATEDRFYTFDGTSEPVLQQDLDLCKNLFFGTEKNPDPHSTFARDSVVSSEILFFSARGVLAYDYLTRTCSFIDEVYHAAAFVRKPTSSDTTVASDFVFLVAQADRIMLFGEDNAGNPIYTRRGESYEAVLSFGTGSVNDEFDEKDLITYVPHLTFAGTVCPVEISLYGCDNRAQQPELLFEETLEDAAVEGAIETFFRNIYYKDEIRFTSTERVEIGARSWQFQVIDSRSATRLAP